MLHEILEDNLYSDSLDRLDITKICDLITELYLVTEVDFLRDVTIEHLTAEDAYSSGHLVLPTLWDLHGF